MLILKYENKQLYKYGENDRTTKSQLTFNILSLYNSQKSLRYVYIFLLVILLYLPA